MNPDARAPRIGLFGGSFDPVHCAHLALARAAIDGLGLDELRWLPAGQPWQKAHALAPAADRLAMLRLALAGQPRCRLDSREIDRGGLSYTIDTVRELRAEQPGAALVLVVGADQYAALPSWRDWRELLAQVELAVAMRPGAAPPRDPALAAWPHAVVPLALGDVASTTIRQRVVAGLPIDAMVPPAVARYIEMHGLYRVVA